MKKEGVEPYFQEFLATLRTPGTRKQYRFDILEFCGGSLPVDIFDLQTLFTKDNILSYIQRLKRRGRGSDKGLKPVTINRKLVALNRFALYLQGENLLTGDPANPCSVPREDCEKWTPKGLLCNEEIRKILLSIEEKEPNKVIRLRDKLFINLGYCTLLKRSEIANLSIEDILEFDDIFALNIPNPDGHDEVIPFPKEVKELFDAYWEELGGDKVVMPDESGQKPVLVSLSNRSCYQRISENFLNRLIKRRAIEANLSPSIHTETLRHSGINFLLDKGTPIADVARLARIKDAKILRAFPSPRIASLSQSAKKLSESIKGNDSGPL